MCFMLAFQVALGRNAAQKCLDFSGLPWNGCQWSNAGRKARLKAGAQRTLEAVACTPLFGPYAAVQPYNGKALP